MKKYLFFISLLSFPFLITLSLAETIYLKSGVAFEGSIIEKTDSFIKLDTGKRILIIKLNDIERTLSDTPEPTPSIKTPEAVIIENVTPTTPSTDTLTAATLPENQITETLSPVEINADDLMPEKNCPNLPLNLENCTPYKCTTEDPMVKNFFSEYTIYGIRDAKCFWKQRLPNNGLMRCRLSEDSRKKIAADLKSNLNNSPALDEAFTNGACRISGYETK